MLLFPPKVEASENISEISANLKNSSNREQFIPNQDKNNRSLVLSNFLSRYNSVLFPYADTIIETADKYEIPWSLVVAIAGVESTFCKFIPSNSCNCWGWNNGKIAFQDYNEAIEIVSKTLKTNYLNKGYNTPEKIGRIYAPPTYSWGGKVRYFMEMIENNYREVHPLKPII